MKDARGNNKFDINKPVHFNKDNEKVSKKKKIEFQKNVEWNWIELN